jgi:hypothetical protein
VTGFARRLVASEVNLLPRAALVPDRVRCSPGEVVEVPSDPCDVAIG